MSEENLNLKFTGDRVLNQLLEKKDLELYLRTRKKVLLGNIKDAANLSNPQDRQPTIEKIEIRIKEIDKLLHHLSEGTIVEQSKQQYREAFPER